LRCQRLLIARRSSRKSSARDSIRSTATSGMRPPLMNFTYIETLRYIVVPQAWKVMLPPAFSFFVLFIKDTALASQIGVVELTFAGKVLANKGFPAALTFGTILVLYFLLSWPLARFGRWMEVKLAPTRTR